MQRTVFPLHLIASLLLVALVAGTAGPALADGSLTYSADGGDMGRLEMTERWRGGALRTDIAGVEAYMLLRDGEIYSITSAGGRVMVMALSALADLPQAQGAQSQGQMKTGAGLATPSEVLEIDPTGNTKEVAGVTGELHEISWLDEDGASHTDSAVLSDDPRLLENQQLKMEMANLVQGQESNALLEALQDKGLAALTFGDRFEVLSLEDHPGPEGDFLLPAEPMDLGDMMGGMSQ
ncbi:hypothetical protein [Fodinicurvata sediminis]|uniref:hypothetical protein n=1 Tax=Fodinicurvata sediminis TaxID=1121832 RepID=UPI0003B500F0|nr:hypothetical protein [Fodinicurvata sediminis]